MKKKLFATGMGGCVGHYLFDELRKRDDLDLTFLIRSPEKVKYDLSDVNVIKDEFKNIKKYARIIKESDYIIHLLADWGGEDGNHHHTLEMFDCVDPEQIRKILYFSTASILGKNNLPAKEALVCGTPYIRGKYKMHEELVRMPHYAKTVVLYPTWVLGGDEKHPHSHAFMAIKKLKDWLWLLSFFTSDLRFHFIHSKDIAAISSYLLDSKDRAQEFVLGTQAITIGEFIKGMADRFGINRPFRLNINRGLVNALAKIFDKKMGLWDKYCVKIFHQEFSAAAPSFFGLTTSYPHIKSVVNEIFPE